VSDSDIAVRQDMEEEPSDELLGLHRHGLLFVAIGIIPPAEGNLSALEPKNTVVADGDPVGVSPQILEHPFGAVKGRLAIDDPLLMVKRSPEDLKGGRFFEMSDTTREDEIPCLEAFIEMVEELPPKQCGHHPDGYEEPFAARYPSTIGGQTSPGDHAMDMGVVHEVLSPGVKDRHEPDPSAEVLRILCKVPKRFRDRAKQEVVDDLLIHDSQGIQFRGDRKDHMEVLNRQEIFASVLDPLLFPQDLALGAVAIPAGVVGYLDVPACLALLRMPAQHCCPAHLNSTHGTEVLTRQEMSLPILWAVLAEDIRHLDLARLLHQEEA